MGYIITPDEMKALEERAISNGMTQKSMMHEAGKQIGKLAISFVKDQKLQKKALVLAGKGNNGGDGYVVAQMLLHNGFSVIVWQLYPLNPSGLTQSERTCFEELGGKVIDIRGAHPDFPAEGIIIDAVFGTGFTGSPDEKIQSLITMANQSHLPIIAVDIPSGINAKTGDIQSAAIKATITATVEYPKIGFFLKSAYNYIGKLEVCPIGLEPFALYEKMAIKIVEKQEVKQLLPHIERTRHKYQAGHVVGLAGSHGMAGAALLTSFAALKTGSGIVHLLHPDEYTAEFTGVPLEVVRLPYKSNDFETILQALQKPSACFIGPGLGKNDALYEAVFSNFCQKKCVFDADALTWIAKKWPRGIGLGKLPQAILTPHIGELERLLDTQCNQGVTLELLTMCQDYAQEHSLCLVLKGAPTFLFCPNEKPQVVLEGDPGMATAGSGDVLTGILASLLAQKLSTADSMRLGVYLHALSGHYAALDETSYSMTASSISEHLPLAFKDLLSLN